MSFYRSSGCFFVSQQDKLNKELEAAHAERMKMAIEAAADKQLAEAQQQVLLYIGVTSSILIGYKHAANSCLLCFSYVIPTNNRFYICRIDVIPTDNSFMHAEVTSPNTLTSSLISFVMAELSSGICIIKQFLNSVFAC